MTGRFGALVAAAFFVVAAGAVLPSVADTPQTGDLVWGVKQSFRSYITGPIAHGTVTLSDGATQRGEEYAFAPDADASQSSYHGTVRFQGHGGTLDLSFSDPQVVLTTATTGTLSVRVQDAGTDHGRVVLADLNLSAPPTVNGDLRTWTAAPATLTAAGVPAFGGFYEAGSALDPVTFSVVDSVPEPTEPTPTEPTPTEPTPTQPTPTTPTATPRPTTTPTETGPAGRLEWGVKSSFRSYVTGPIAHGSISVSNGATAGSGGYVFGQSSTTADPPSAVGTTSYRGAVTFSGHGGLLALTLSDPQVQVRSASSASLSVLVGGSRVPIADLALASASRSSSGQSVTYTGVPATLTSAGVTVFSRDGQGFYTAGTALDPVTFVVGGTAPVSGGNTRVVASAAAAPAPMKAQVLATAAAQGCTVTEASLRWGFKESFRSYISGSIAHGNWSTSGGATYETPEFSWPEGTGKVDPATGTGRVTFAGSIRFVGHDGALDTTIENPTLILDGENATLELDTAGATMDAVMAGRSEIVERPDVPFVSVSLGDAVFKDGTLKVDDAATALTAEGREAFPNYDVGAAFDPLDVSITLDDECEAESAVAASSDDKTTKTSTALADADWLPWVGGGAIGAVAVLAGVALGGLLRGRRS